MTYPQLFCAEQEQNTDNESSVSSVVSGVGTTMEHNGRGSSGILSVGHAESAFRPGNGATAKQLATLRSFWKSSSKELSAYVAENEVSAAPATCVNLFDKMPQPDRAVTRIYGFMSRVVICWVRKIYKIQQFLHVDAEFVYNS